MNNKDISFKKLLSKNIVFFLLPLMLILSCWEGLDEFNEKLGADASLKYLLYRDIQSAQALHDSAIEGSSVGLYTSGVKAPFQGEINSALDVYNDAASTDADYTTARADLASVVSVFNTRRIRNLDVVFVIDVTGTMAGYINAAKMNVFNAITDIQSNNSDAKFGLISFREFNSWISHASHYPNGYIVNNDLTTDSASVAASVNALIAEQGGDPDEAHVAAMFGSANDITWTPGSDRIVILITASPAHNIPTPTSGYPGPSLEDTWLSLMDKNINTLGFYCLTGPAQDDLGAFFLPIEGIIYPHAVFSSGVDSAMNTWISWWPGF